MQVRYHSSFMRHIAKIKDKHLAQSIEFTINEVKNAITITEIPRLKKLKTGKDAYRIRVGEYRIGIYIENNIVTFSCFMHRKDIYRYFP